MEANRLTELDGLRGIAAVSVVVYHYFTRYDQLFGHNFNVHKLFALGQYGVHLFFIVSGFVIYWTISRVDKPLEFLWSRFSRLYPPFWVAVILTFVTTSIFSLPDRDVDSATFILNLLMFHEYLGAKHVDGVYWTLTIELAFYFWITILLIFGKVKDLEKILILWLLAATLINFCKFDLYIDQRLTKLLMVKYVGLFAAGICFYKYKFKRHSIYTHAVFILSITSLYFTHPYKAAVLICVFYLVFGIVLMNCAKFLKSRALVYFGTISYSLYLVHQNIGYVIINESYSNGLNPFVGILVAFIFSVFLSHLMLIFIERPSVKKLKAIYKEIRKN